MDIPDTLFSQGCLQVKIDMLNDESEHTHLHFDDEILRQFSSVFSPGPGAACALPAYESLTSVHTDESLTSSFGQTPDFNPFSRLDQASGTLTSLAGTDDSTGIVTQLNTISAGIQQILDTLPLPQHNEILTQDKFCRTYKVFGEALPHIIATAVAIAYRSFPLEWPTNQSPSDSHLLKIHTQNAFGIIMKAHVQDCQTALEPGQPRKYNWQEKQLTLP